MTYLVINLTFFTSGNAPATTIANHIRSHATSHLIRKHKLNGTKVDELIKPGSKKGVIYFLNGEVTGHQSPWEAKGLKDPYTNTPPSSKKRPSITKSDSQLKKLRKFDAFPVSPEASDVDDNKATPNRRLRSNHVVNINLDDLEDLPKPSSKKKSPKVDAVNKVETPITPPSPAQSDNMEQDEEEANEQDENDEHDEHEEQEEHVEHYEQEQPDQQEQEDFHISMMQPSETLPLAPQTAQESPQPVSQGVKATQQLPIEQELDELSPMSHDMDCVESNNNIICNLATPPLSPKLSDDISIDALQELDSLWTQQINYTQRKESLIDNEVLNSLSYVESIRAAARQ